MKRFGVVVLMGLTLTACNKTPDSFTIGSVDGVKLEEVQDGPTIRSTVNHTWKLKVGQQIQFNESYAFTSYRQSDAYNRLQKGKTDIVYLPISDANDKVEVQETAGVIVGKYVGEALVCSVRFDSKRDVVTHSACSRFEVVQ